MSIGSAFRQIVEVMPGDQCNAYRKRIMTKVIKQFGEVVKNEESDILNKINDLVSRLHKRADIREQITSRKSVQEGKPDKLNDLLREAATTIDIITQRIHELEEELKITKKKLEDYRDLDCLVCK